MRAALFVTCVVDGLSPEVGKATWKLLRRLGVKLEFPAAQSCCGQMHVNSGHPDLALGLVRHHIDTFEGFDAVITPSGSCAGAVRHQHADVARRFGDTQLAKRADAVGARSYELSEFIVDVLGVTDVGAWFPHSVTYHPSCHGLRLLQLGDRPAALLRAVDGIDLRELPDATSCCGFGGTFALKNADVSGAILADKMAAIDKTGARVCTAGDASCLLHIGGGLRLADSSVHTAHLAEVLASTKADPWIPR